MDKKIKGDFPLGSKQIKKAFGGKIKIILYSQLKNYNSINELLEPYDKVVILYYWKKYFGHWICIFKNVNGNIEVFDSLGSWIDDTLYTIDKEFRKQNNEDYKYLTKLLYDCNCEVEYNDKQLQSNKTSTCGRWCVYRLKRDDLTIEEFQDLFKKNKNKDSKIISLTNTI